MRHLEVRRLERWDASMSDGCSVPRVLRAFLSRDTPQECHACERHDEAYYYGGSRALRRAADAEFRRALRAAGVSAAKAWAFWVAVRVGGAPWYAVAGVSWAFGGHHFRYSAAPAEPEPSADPGPHA